MVKGTDCTGGCRIILLKGWFKEIYDKWTAVFSFWKRRLLYVAMENGGWGGGGSAVCAYLKIKMQSYNLKVTAVCSC